MKLLNDIGLALFGECYKNQLAKELNVSERTMRRWLNSSDEIPSGVLSDCKILIVDRIKILNTLVDVL